MLLTGGKAHRAKVFGGKLSGICSFPIKCSEIRPAKVFEEDLTSLQKLDEQIKLLVETLVGRNGSYS